MKRSAKFLVHIQLNTTLLTPTLRAGLVASITRNAPSSDLYKKEPAVQSTVTDLTALEAGFTTANAAVAAAQAYLTLQEQLCADAGAALDRGLILLKGLVENKATTPGEVKEIGFAVREPSSKADLLVAPDWVDATSSRTHGRFTVTVRDALHRVHFAAQMSLEPIGPSTWIDLPGIGRRRKVVSGYPPGTRVWVRFAALLGQDRGAWGPPVSVVVP